MGVSENFGLTIYSFVNYPVTAWKNGQGVTRNIVMSESESEDFDWRLSLADVSRSGSFSEFPNYDRIIVLLDGEGFLLSFKNGVKKQLNQAYKPFVFDGGIPTTCILNEGLSRDLNVMVRRGCVEANWSMLDVREKSKIDMEANIIHLFFCLQGSFQIQENDSQMQNVSEWDCVKYFSTKETALQFKSSTVAKVFHIRLSYL